MSIQFHAKTHLLYWNTNKTQERIQLLRIHTAEEIMCISCLTVLKCWNGPVNSACSAPNTDECLRRSSAEGVAPFTLGKWVTVCTFGFLLSEALCPGWASWPVCGGLPVFSSRRATSCLWFNAVALMKLRRALPSFYSARYAEVIHGVGGFIHVIGQLSETFPDRSFSDLNVYVFIIVRHNKVNLHI